MEKMFLFGALLGAVGGALVVANSYKARALVKKSQEDLLARVDEMMAAGLEREVRALTARGLWPEDEGAMQAIGYKEIAFALRGAYGMDEAVRPIKRESRRYAKRQMTWFRADARVRWIRWEDYASAQELEEAFAARVRAELDELKEIQP